MTGMRRIGKLLGTCFVVGTFVMGCGILPTEEEFDVAPLIKEYEGNHYNKYTITKGDMVKKVSISATFQGTKKVEVQGSEEGGQIKKVCVQKGQKVKVGTVLVQEYLDETEEQLKECKRQISELKLQIKQSQEMKQRELEQLKRTGGTEEEKKNVRSQFDAQIKNCQSSMKLTELEIKEAEEEIRSAVITSEVEGRVVFADHSFDGGYANQENLLVKVQGKKKNRFICKTKYADRLKNGQNVVVTVAGSQYECSIQKVASETLYLYPKKNNSIKNGVVGTFDLTLKEKKDVISLPLALVYDMGGKKVVYMEGKNGVKEIREVTLGESIDNMVEITGGLKENEQIITN